MRSAIVLVLAILISCTSGVHPAHAKPHGRGNGNAGGRFGASAMVGASALVGNPAFSSHVPRGHAWGRRRKLGLAAPGSTHGRLASARDGDRIFRAGIEWQFDAASNTWVPLQ